MFWIKINPTENWDNYEKDRKVITDVTSNIDKNLRYMKEQDEMLLVEDIRKEIAEITKNINNKAILKEKRDSFSLRNFEGASKYLNTVKDEKDITNQYTMCVMAVQTLLQNMGYLKDRGWNQAGTEWIDGLYRDANGSQTQEALKDFQKERNQENSPKIRQDWKINYQTIQALLKKKEKTDTEQQTPEQDEKREKLNKVATMTFQELIEEGLTDKNAIKNLADAAWENNYQIPESVEKNLKIIEYINDTHINDDILTLKKDQELTLEDYRDFSREIMKRIKEKTEAIEAVCWKEGENLLDKEDKIQDSTIKEKAHANYEKIWNILNKRNGILSEYKDKRIDANIIHALRQDFIILKDALNRNNYDEKGNPIDKTKAYFTDRKDVDTYCTNDPQKILDNRKKLANAEETPKIKQKEENWKTDEKNLQIKKNLTETLKKFIKNSDKPQAKELIIQCFNDTTHWNKLDTNKILYGEWEATKISRGESNWDTTPDNTSDSNEQN